MFESHRPQCRPKLHPQLINCATISSISTFLSISIPIWKVGGVCRSHRDLENVSCLVPSPSWKHIVILVFIPVRKTFQGLYDLCQLSLPTPTNLSLSLFFSFFFLLVRMKPRKIKEDDAPRTIACPHKVSNARGKVFIRL